MRSTSFLRTFASPAAEERDAGTVSAGINGWTWGDCCELQSLRVEPSLRGRGLATRLLATAEAAAARGCSQTVHFTYAFQARAPYERNGYELVGRVEDFPSGTDVLWYRKRLKIARIGAETGTRMHRVRLGRRPRTGAGGRCLPGPSPVRLPAWPCGASRAAALAGRAGKFQLPGS